MLCWGGKRRVTDNEDCFPGTAPRYNRQALLAREVFDREETAKKGMKDRSKQPQELGLKNWKTNFASETAVLF